MSIGVEAGLVGFSGFALQERVHRLPAAVGEEYLLNIRPAHRLAVADKRLQPWRHLRR
ncbi:hypothetical protein D3C87_1592280 [compost metagenome]